MRRWSLFENFVRARRGTETALIATQGMKRPPSARHSLLHLAAFTRLLLSSFSLGSMSDPDLALHFSRSCDALIISTSLVAQTLCKCQYRFSSVSSSFDPPSRDSMLNFSISHNMSDEFYLLTSYDIYQLFII